MKSRSTRAALTATIITSAVLLTGCTGGGGEDSGSTTGTLDFVTDKAAWEPDFEALNSQSSSEVEIELATTGYSDANQYDAFVRQSFRTAQSPGLFSWHVGDSLAELVDEGLVAETTDIWDRAIEQGWVSEDLKQDYTVDGAQYCVPMNVAYWVMYYNKTIFDQYGLAEPTTWDELMSTAETLKSNGVTPFYQTTNLFTFPWFQQLVAGTDPDLYNGLSTGEVSYTDPAIVEIMEDWQDQHEMGWFSDAGTTTDPAVMLNQGDMAMINFGSFFGGSLEAAGMEAGVDYDFFVIPARNGELETTPVAVETGPLCTAENSSQKTLGLAYAEWWMSPEAQTAWGDARGDVPFNPMTDVANQDLAELGEELATDDYSLVTRYFEAAPTPILTVALEQFGAYNANPGDPLPMLEAIQAEADDYWADQE